MMHAWGNGVELVNLAACVAAYLNLKGMFQLSKSFNLLLPNARNSRTNHSPRIPVCCLIRLYLPYVSTLIIVKSILHCAIAFSSTLIAPVPEKII